MRIQDEILMQTLRETGTNKELTSIFIAEQMQIAQSMGINVRGADKDEEYAAELTKELGLSSGGAEEVKRETGKDEENRIAAGGVHEFNLDTDTFMHDNPSYQETAFSNIRNNEQLLGLVHTQSSMLHAKATLKSIPEG